MKNMKDSVWEDFVGNLWEENRGFFTQNLPNYLKGGCNQPHVKKNMHKSSSSNIGAYVISPRLLGVENSKTSWWLNQPI